MGHRQIVTCDHCGDDVHSCSAPLWAYVVVAFPPDYTGPRDITELPLPDFARELSTRPVPREDGCVWCFAARFGLPLKDKYGHEVPNPCAAHVTPAAHLHLERFVAPAVPGHSPGNAAASRSATSSAATDDATP
jgi:hypothetical protein